MIKLPDGTPFSNIQDLNKDPLAPAPFIPSNQTGLQAKTGAEGLKVVTEKFSSKRAEELCMKTGAILSKTYKGYGWFVRAIGNKRHQTGIGISLTEYLSFGGSQSVFYINPDDIAKLDEMAFEVYIKQVGGEMLERGGLNRVKKADSDMNGPDKSPEGFADIQLKRRTHVMANTVQEFTDIVNKHIADLRSAATYNDSSDARDDK